MRNIRLFSKKDRLNIPSANRAGQENRADFDQYSENYGQILNKSLRISGEKDDYFDRYKLDCLQRWVIPKSRGLALLDFGCGIGKLTQLIARSYPDSTVLGYDISINSIRAAQGKWVELKNCAFDFRLPDSKAFDVILCANVFHHIEKDRRLETVDLLKSRLKADGAIVVFEQNPYNPLTRYVAKTCVFDRDAVLISAGQFAKLATLAGLQLYMKRYIVFFPGIMKFMRFLETRLGFLPIGAQYMILLKNADHLKKSFQGKIR